MGSLDGFSCENPLGCHGENSLHRRYETPQMHVFLTLFSDCPISTKKTLNRRKQGLLGRNIRRISVEYGDSFQSHEHQLPIILWVRIDGLDELDDCLPHEIRLINVIVVADGGHLVLENDG